MEYLGRFVIALLGRRHFPLLLQFLDDRGDLLAVQFGQLGDVSRADGLALFFHRFQHLFFFGIHRDRSSFGDMEYTYEEKPVPVKYIFTG